MKSPTYFNRWLAYPRSCLGHTLQGLGFGLLILAPNLLLAMAAWPLSVAGVMLLMLYVCYQFGSGARKIVNRGHADSIGWDVADASVGLWLAVLIWGLVVAYRAGWFGWIG